MQKPAITKRLILLYRA